MSHDRIGRDDVFGRKAPPAGGLRRLRARLDAREPRPWAWGAVALVPALAVVVLLFWPSRVDVVGVARVTAGPSEVALGFARAAGEPLTVAPGSEAAVARVTTTDPRVAMYVLVR